MVVVVASTGVGVVSAGVIVVSPGVVDVSALVVVSACTYSITTFSS